jgi:hypothetical protein
MSSILHLVELLSLLCSAIISHHGQILGSFFAFMSQSRLALGGGQRRNGNSRENLRAVSKEVVEIHVLLTR